MRALDITGQRYGNLVAVRRSEVKIGKVFAWLFVCDCGNEVVRTAGDVRSSFNRGRMCACKSCTEAMRSIVPVRMTHGMRNTRFYDCWRDMRKRCNNPNSKSYKAYGGRGIKVCDRWNKFENFYDDMFESYWDGATIERKDVNGNYEPSNCCWLSRSEQGKTMRKRYTGLDVKALAEKHGIAMSTLYDRIRSGWPEDMLFIPTSSSNTGLRLRGQQVYKKLGEVL